MMEQSLHGEIMKTQDLPDVVVTVSRNPRGYKLGWDFLRANWHTMIKKSVHLIKHILYIPPFLHKFWNFPCFSCYKKDPWYSFKKVKKKKSVIAFEKPNLSAFITNSLCRA